MTVAILEVHNRQLAVDDFSRADIRDKRIVAQLKGVEKQRNKARE